MILHDEQPAQPGGQQITVGAGYTAILVPLDAIQAGLRRVWQLTGTENFDDALELAWFKFDMRRDVATKNKLALAVAVWRACRDGNVKPPVDLEAEYKKIVEEGRGQEPGHAAGLAPGR